MKTFQRVRSFFVNEKSLRSLIFAVVLSAFVVVILSVSGYFIYQIYESAQRNLIDLNKEVNNKKSLEFRMPIYRAIGVARTMSMTSDYLFESSVGHRDSLLACSINNITERLSYYNEKHLYQSYFFSLDNKYVPGASNPMGRTIYEQSITQKKMNKRETDRLKDTPMDLTIARCEEKFTVAVSDPYYTHTEGMTNQELVVALAAPIRYHGETVGSAGVEIPLAEMQNLLNKLELAKGSFAYVVSTNGTIVAHSDEKNVGQNINAVVKKQELIGLLESYFSNKDENATAGSASFQRYTTFIAPIVMDQQNTTWALDVTIPNTVLYSKQNTATLIGILFALICVVIMGFLTRHLASRITSPILNINKVVNKLALGEIKNTQLIESSSKTEIGQIENSVNSLIASLSKTSDFALEIGKGNFATDYDLLSKNDDLGHSLLDMKKSLLDAQKLEENRKREEQQSNWFNEGIAKFAEILRQNNADIDELTYQVISNLVRYVDGIEGGVFVQDEEEKEKMSMTACFAFDRRKQMQKDVAYGEGLVGRCFAERERIYITDIPHNYLSITSGLGEVDPVSILLVPLKVNEEVLGVIEIASFKKMEEYTIKFVEKVSESIASTLSGVRVNVRTSRLLEQTKLQAEEMAAAEEEMRQNLEELQSTQEEMARIQEDQKSIVQQSEVNAELVKIILSKTSDLLVFKDVNGCYQNVSKSAAAANLDIEIGKNANEVFAALVANAIEDEDRTIMNQKMPVSNGKRKLEAVNGVEYTIKYSKYPVITKDGDVKGVLAMCQIV